MLATIYLAAPDTLLTLAEDSPGLDHMHKVGMPRNGLSEDLRYLVLVNEEKQHSIRRGDVAWSVGRDRTRPKCLAFVEKVWTDIRPLSLRHRMAEVRS